MYWPQRPGLDVAPIARDGMPLERLSPLAERLVADIAAQIAVLRTTYHVDVTDEQCRERARNITQGLLCNYEFKARP